MSIRKKVGLVIYILIGIFIFLGCVEQNIYNKPIVLKNGPHLFIDNYLIADQQLLNRTINNPAKKAEPIILGGGNRDQNFQPYMSVLRDPDTGEVLDESMTEVARLKVNQVKEKLSIADVISGSATSVTKGMTIHQP